MLLLNKGADVNVKNIKDEITPLHLGAQKGDVAIIEPLLKFGANINSKDSIGRTALHFACSPTNRSSTYLAVVPFLLENGSDINITTKSNKTPLDEARTRMQYGHEVQMRAIVALERHIVKMKTADLYVCHLVPHKCKICDTLGHWSLSRVKVSDKFLEKDLRVLQL
ncbi:hypothetical protein QYM36_000679 [Artemia franciscana]|uniref:Uncharacterized protein n=1 Tax=Artemia franciscana TaxID=6661 RepID=A0AA88LDE8_ARTSF|nr:hypothetical protein QYM36_000679 [Artemia franciscana]